MGVILGWVLMGVLIFMLALETLRYGRARARERDSLAGLSETAGLDGEPELPYPRRRYSRRVAIGLLLIAVVALAIYWPDVAVGIDFALLGAMALAILAAFVLILKDLKETSLDVLAHAQQMDAASSERLAQAIERELEGKKRS